MERLLELVEGGSGLVLPPSLMQQLLDGIKHAKPIHINDVVHFGKLALLVAENSPEVETITAISEFVTTIAIPLLLLDCSNQAQNISNDSVPRELSTPNATLIATHVAGLAMHIPHLAEHVHSFCTPRIVESDRYGAGEVVACIILAGLFIEANVNGEQARNIAKAISAPIVDMCFGDLNVAPNVREYVRTHVLTLVLAVDVETRPNVVQRVWSRSLTAFGLTGYESECPSDSTVSQWQSWSCGFSDEHPFPSGLKPSEARVIDRATALDILCSHFHLVHATLLHGLVASPAFWMMVQYGLLVPTATERDGAVKALAMIRRQAKQLLSLGVEACERATPDVQHWCALFGWHPAKEHRRAWDIFFMIFAALEENQFHLSLEAFPQIFSLRAMGGQAKDATEQKQTLKRTKRKQRRQRAHDDAAGPKRRRDAPMDEIALHASWVEVLLRLAMQHEVTGVRMAALQYALETPSAGQGSLINLAVHRHLFFDVLLPALGTELFYGLPPAPDAKLPKAHGDGWRTHWRRLISTPPEAGPVRPVPSGASAGAFGSQVLAGLMNILTLFSTYGERATFLRQFICSISTEWGGPPICDVAMAIYLEFLTTAASSISLHAQRDYDDPVLVCPCGMSTHTRTDAVLVQRTLAAVHSLIGTVITHHADSFYSRCALMRLAFDAVLALASPAWALRGAEHDLGKVPNRFICYNHFWSILSLLPTDILSLENLRPEHDEPDRADVDVGIDPGVTARSLLGDWLHINLAHDQLHGVVENWFVHGLRDSVNVYLKGGEQVVSTNKIITDCSLPSAQVIESQLHTAKRQSWGLSVALELCGTALQESASLLKCGCDHCMSRGLHEAKDMWDTVIAPFDTMFSGLFSRPYSSPEGNVNGLILLTTLASRAVLGVGSVRGGCVRGRSLRHLVVHVLMTYASEFTSLLDSCIKGWHQVATMKDTASIRSFLCNPLLQTMILSPHVIGDAVALGLSLYLSATLSVENQAAGSLAATTSPPHTNCWRADFGWTSQPGTERITVFHPAEDIGGAAGASALRGFVEAASLIAVHCREICTVQQIPIVAPDQDPPADQLQGWASLCRIAPLQTLSVVLPVFVDVLSPWSLMEETRVLAIRPSDAFGCPMLDMVQWLLDTSCPPPPPAEIDARGWGTQALRFYQCKWNAVGRALQLTVLREKLEDQFNVDLLCQAMTQCGQDAIGSTKESIAPLMDALSMLLPLACKLLLKHDDARVHSVVEEAVNCIWEAVHSMKWGHRRAILQGHMHFFAAVFQPELFSFQSTLNNVVDDEGREGPDERAEEAVRIPIMLQRLMTQVLDACASQGTPEGVATCLAGVCLQAWRCCEPMAVEPYISHIVDMCSWPRSIPKVDNERPQDPVLLFPSRSAVHSSQRRADDDSGDDDLNVLEERMYRFDTGLWDQAAAPPPSDRPSNRVPIVDVSARTSGTGAVDALFRHFHVLSGRDYFVRVLVNSWFNQLSRRSSDNNALKSLLASIADGLLNALAAEKVPDCGPCDKYRANCIVYRRRTRLWQSLALLATRLRVPIERRHSVMDKFWTEFENLDFNAVRQFADLIATEILLHSPSEVTRRFIGFLDPGVAGPVARSACLVTAAVLPEYGRRLVAQSNGSTDDSGLTASTLHLLLDRILPWAMSGFNTPRAAAHYCICEADGSGLFDAGAEQALGFDSNASQEDGVALEVTVREALGTARRIARFVQMSREALHCMEKFAAPDVPSPETLDKYCMSLLFDGMPNAHNPQVTETIPTLVFSLLDLHVLPPPDSIMHEEMESQSVQDSSDHDADKPHVVHALQTEPSRFNYQKKIAPWEDMDALKLAERAEPVKDDHDRRRQRPRLPLVLVASLIDKVPNLAGLCRTCECFGAEALVVSSKKVVKDPRFLKMSVTSEKWQPLIEAPESELKAFLRSRKRDGYTLVGVEQTQNSVDITSFEFPERTVMLLGKEREGIPLELIQELDMCIEIPQLGVVRSLNVHVTGALVVYDYAKQMMVKNKG